MITSKPEDRPTITEILKSEWLKEIKVLNEDQIKKLDEEIKKKFLRIEPKVLKLLLLILLKI